MNWYRKSSNSGSFLESADSAWEWAKQNVTDIETDEESENSYERSVAISYKERAAQYSDAYFSIIRKPEITVYRAIRASSLEELNWDELGVYWSLEKKGASVLGSAPAKSQYNHDFLITATVSPQSIDWEHGFTSFMYYGEDQWEIALITGSPVTVISVDDKSIAPRKCFASRFVMENSK
jgi:hypothetical protein